MSKRLYIKRLTDSGALTSTQVDVIPVTELVDNTSTQYSVHVFNSLNATQRAYTDSFNDLLMGIPSSDVVRIIVTGVISRYDTSVISTNILDIVDDVYPTTLQSDITALQSDVTTLSGDSFSYAEATMSAAQIIGASDGGSGPFQILGGPGLGNYYVFESIIFEYTHVTTAYTGAAGHLQIDNGGFPLGGVADGLFKTASSSQAIVVSGGVNVDATPIRQFRSPSNGVIEVVYNDGASGALATGDGTLLIKMTYSIKTRGTEL